MTGPRKPWPHAPAWRLGAALALTALAPLSGCVSAEPRGPGDPPEGTEPIRLILALQARLVDYDGDVYPDTAIASVYLMGNWPKSLHPRGTAEFTLYNTEDEVLGVWKFDEQETQQALREGVVGPGYFFPLRITEFIDDRMPETPLKIDAKFTLEDGTVLESPGKKEKLFGRAGG